MAWPSDQDYNEAIQNPRIAFADQELQSGQVGVDAMGIPKPRSGQFATVYKVVSNGAAHAVRCFRYDNPEHRIRYQAIAEYLSRNTLPYMVSFRYMSQGIRVGPPHGTRSSGCDGWKATAWSATSKRTCLRRRRSRTSRRSRPLKAPIAHPGGQIPGPTPSPLPTPSHTTSNLPQANQPPWWKQKNQP